MSQPKLKVKVNNNEDTRLWRYSQPNDYKGLCSFIATTWHNDDFIAQYEDDEGDLITIASQQDLNDAFELAKEENKKSLKIFVENFVKQKRTQNKRSQSESKTEPKPEPEEKEEPMQFDSIGAMVIDFLSNPQIIQLLPEVFAVLIPKLTAKGSNLSPEDIATMISSEMNDERFAVIRTHPLYIKYSAISIPYIANKIASQQSLYPHFQIETIKTWIFQLIEMLSGALRQKAETGGCIFEDIVIDIEYPTVTDTGKVIHFGVECDLCGQYPIIGDRYKCSICEDWDCCPQCEPKHDHPLIKFKKSIRNHENSAFKGLTEIIKRLSTINEVKNDIESDIVVDCICGSKMECLLAKSAYGHCNRVYCDCCGVQSFSEMIYHCPKGKDPVHHSNGHDLCVKCANKKVLDDKEKEKKEEIPEKEDKVEAEAEAEPEPEQPQEAEEDEFEFASQLAQIKQIMAYSEDKDEWIKGLLMVHKGDIAKVVPLLLQ